MKISKYLIDENSAGLASAIAETMALYEANPAVDLFSNFADFYNTLSSPDTVFVRNTISYSNETKVETTLFFWNNFQIDSIIRQRRADNGDISVAKRLVKLNVLEIMREITGYNPGPWGILRGIRPGKIVHRLLDSGYAGQDIPQLLGVTYGVEPQKAQLLTDIAVRQRPFLLNPAEAKKIISVYVGIPYCPSRCLYCSFPANTLPAEEQEIASFMEVLKKDIDDAGEFISKHGLKVQTVYLGGGTPTSLNDTHFFRLLNFIRKAFITEFTVEFTVEAGRPDSINDAKLTMLKDFAVSRVSVNPQTMQEKTLKHIGRRHTVQDIIDMFQKMRGLAIPVINMDVIMGLPGETEKDVADSLQQIAVLRPDNLTVHTLAIKRGSILQSKAGAYVLPDERVVRAMLEIAQDYAEKMNMSPYYLYRQKHMTGNMENIGYAHEGKECIYNIQIIEERQTIIGIGPAAGTKVVDGETEWKLSSCYNAKDVNTYKNSLSKYLSDRNYLLRQIFS